MPEGYGAIELHKLLTADRFQFTGLLGKNLYTDAEIKRIFKRGTVKDWKSFNNLFGGDEVKLEPKGHEARDWISKGKGIFIGNLPFFNVDNPAAASRMLVAVTRDNRRRARIPDLDRIIYETEKNEIATLLIQVLKGLIAREFIFPGETTPDATEDILDNLADPVANFIEETVIPTEAGEEKVDDLYAKFKEWCDSKGIPVIAKQTFTKKFGWNFPKKKKGTHNNRYYVFTQCALIVGEIEPNSQTSFEVGHGSKFQKSPQISAGGERYRCVQHAPLTLRDAREEK